MNKSPTPEEIKNLQRQAFNALQRQMLPPKKTWRQRLVSWFHNR